jgi:hypothetical protein
MAFSTLFDPDEAGAEARYQFLRTFSGSIFLTCVATLIPAIQRKRRVKQLTIGLTFFDLVTTALNQEELIVYQTIKFILSSLCIFSTSESDAKQSAQPIKPSRTSAKSTSHLMNDEEWVRLAAAALQHKSTLQTQIQSIEKSTNKKLAAFAAYVKNPKTRLYLDTPSQFWQDKSPTDKMILFITLSLTLSSVDKIERADYLKALLGKLLNDPDFREEVRHRNSKNYFDYTPLKEPLLSLVRAAAAASTDDRSDTVSDASSETAETESPRGSLAGLDEEVVHKPTRPNQDEKDYESSRKKAEAKVLVEKKRAEQQAQERYQRLQADYAARHTRFEFLKQHLHKQMQALLESNAFLQEKLQAACSKAKPPLLEIAQALSQTALSRAQALETQHQLLMATEFSEMPSPDALEKTIASADAQIAHLDALCTTIDLPAIQAAVEYETLFINTLLLIDEHQGALQKCRSQADRLRMSRGILGLPDATRTLLFEITAMQQQLDSFNVALTAQPSTTSLEKIIGQITRAPPEITKWAQLMEPAEKEVQQKKDHIKLEILSLYATLDRLNSSKTYTKIANISDSMKESTAQMQAHLSELDPTQRAELEPLLEALQDKHAILDQCCEDAKKIASKLHPSRKIDMTSTAALSHSFKEAYNAVAHAETLSKILKEAQKTLQHAQEITKQILSTPLPSTPLFRADPMQEKPYFGTLCTDLSGSHPSLFKYLVTPIDPCLEHRLVVGSSASGTLTSDLDLLFLYCLPADAKDALDYQNKLAESINTIMRGFGYTLIGELKMGLGDTPPYFWYNSSWHRPELLHNQAVDITLNFGAAGCMKMLLEKSLRERVISAKAKAIDLSTASLYHFGERTLLCKKREDLSPKNHDYILFYLTYILANTRPAARKYFLKQYRDFFVCLNANYEHYEKGAPPTHAARLLAKKTHQRETTAIIAVYRSLNKIKMMADKAKPTLASAPH